MLETYEQFLSDPDILSLRSEMALMDARLAQQLRRLETNDSKEAWRLVSQAHVTLRMILDSPTGECDSDDLAAISLSLRNALDAHATDKEVWDDVQAIIMVRTKLADTERRRIVDARRFLTIEEANAMLAFVMDTVFTNVKDASVRAQIAERMKMFAQRSAQSGTQVIEQMPDDAMIEDIDERAEVVMGDEVIDA